MSLRSLAATLPLLLLPACITSQPASRSEAGPEAGPPAEAASAPRAPESATVPPAEDVEHAAEQRPYVLVLLRGVPVPAGFDREVIVEANRGHMANIKRLAEEGSLLVAGPFLEPKQESKLRGLFLFDRAEPEDALALADTDPALRAGLLVAEAIPCSSADRVGRSLELWAAAVERGEEPGMSSYILAVAEPSEAGNADAIDHDPAVLFSLRLHGSRAGERMLLLDFREGESARDLLERYGAEPAHWILHPWLGSEQLRETRRH